MKHLDISLHSSLKVRNCLFKTCFIWALLLAKVGSLFFLNVTNVDYWLCSMWLANSVCFWNLIFLIDKKLSAKFGGSIIFVRMLKTSLHVEKRISWVSNASINFLTFSVNWTFLYHLIDNAQLISVTTNRLKDIQKFSMISSFLATVRK